MSLLLASALALVGQVDHADTSVRAVLSDDFGAIALTVHSRYTPGVDVAHVDVFCAADRYRALLPSMDPAAARQLYPAQFDRGGFEDVLIEIDGARCQPAVSALTTGERIFACPRPTKAGQTVGVRITAKLIVPERFGPFGKRRRHLTLAGGWFPFVARPDAASPAGPLDVAVELPSATFAILGGQPHRPPIPQPGSRRRIQALLSNVAQAGLHVRPTNLRVRSFAGGAARYAATDLSHLEPIGETIAGGLRFWREEGLPEVVSKSAPLVVLRAPLRHDLARKTADVVLLSDRAFRLVPLDRGYRFHRFPILREVFGALAVRHLAGSEPPRTRGIAADAVAAWMVDRYVASRYGHAEDAFDVLDIWSFIPRIDSLLYAPDLPFIGAFFRVIREDDPLRAPVEDHRLPVVRGKIIYDKLLDRVGEAGVDRVLSAVVNGTPLTEAVAGALGGEAAAQAFFETWLGPYPDVEYVLADVTSAPHGDSHTATVLIERYGDAVAEPLQVLLEDADGGTQVVTASASAAPRRVVTATLAAPIDGARLDPFGRIAESWSEARPSPRRDNTTDPKWKVLLNNFNLLVAATEADVETALDLGFYQEYDVHWRHALRADYGADAIGLSARTRYSFGARATAARLAQSIGLSASGEYLREGFAKTDESGFAATVSLSYGYDDRKSNWAKETGFAARISATYQHVFGAEPKVPQTRDALAVTAKAVGQWQVSLAHQLAARLSAGAFAVGTPRPQLLYAIGGRRGVRGYATDAAVGRVRGIASVEWLHALVPELQVNGFEYAWLNGLDGALFADVAIIAEDLAALGDVPILGDIGYGLRFNVDWLGVTPGVMAIDVAFPLVDPDGGGSPGPPGVYLDFSQSFTVF